jgi:DNA-binding PadR family transcriptional regulator
VFGVTVSYALLGLLKGASRHGYDLKQSYDRRFGGARPIRFGQVYRILAQLERDGRVEVAGVEAGAGPDRKRCRYPRSGRGRGSRVAGDAPAAGVHTRR